MHAAHTISRGRFYGTLLLMLAASYAWIAYNAMVRAQGGEGISICIVRNVTGVPCPGCGTTRSVVHVLHGDIHDALTSNPLGIVVAVALVVLPIWIALDLARGGASLMDAYYAINTQGRRRSVVIGAVITMLCLWIWNLN